MISRILIFGDTHGIPLLLRALPQNTICGIVAAAIRPQYHNELERLAKEIGVPFRVQPFWKSPTYLDFLEWVRFLSPDLIWINSYSMILHEELLKIPQSGVLNIHGALLPQYRGCNPMQWAILNRETETGVTLHEVNAGIDQGSIIAQKKVPLAFEDTWIDIQNRIAAETEVLLEETVPSVLSGNWRSETQEERIAWYGRRRSVEDGEFSWSDAVLDIYNMIRALVAPHPGAFYKNSGNRVILDYYLPLDEIIRLKIQHTRGQRFLRSSQYHLRVPEGNNEECSMLRSMKDKSPTYSRNFCETQFKPGNDKTLFFVIEDNESDNVIGGCQLYNIDWIQGRAQIYVYTSEENHSEVADISSMIHVLVDFVFKDLYIQHIYLHMNWATANGIENYEKWGFKYEGVFKNSLNEELMVMTVEKEYFYG